MGPSPGLRYCCLLQETVCEKNDVRCERGPVQQERYKNPSRIKLHLPRASSSEPTLTE